MIKLKRVFNKLLFGSETKRLAFYLNKVKSVRAFEDDFKALSDEALRDKTQAFKERLKQGESLDDLLPEAFAVVCEAADRTLGMRHYDVQIMGGVVLHEGKITEMKTGEGKTLVSTLPAYLNALEEKGVFIVTVNDYLAKRDSEWMGQIYTFLGLSVGLIQNNQDQADRIKAYDADITYGTNNEFGFDYLRDHLCWSAEEYCQKRRHYAIIDEVDSILIDEARTPLIISGPIQDSTAKYKPIVKIVKTLVASQDFTIDEKQKNVVLLDQGIEKIEQSLNIKNIYSVENMDVAHMATQCLKALHLFKKDVDYVVKDGQVLIVDEFTGRLMEGRRFSDGLHQSIEACENLSIQNESQTLASITFQNYFRLFPKLSGMTGTAVTEAAEFEKIYSLSVIPIPTSKPLIRQDKSDIIYKTKEAKFNAIVSKIKTLHQKGQPILAGTISIENSELISRKLKQAGIPHHVLNAKHHSSEADIIAKAGQKGAVTIATNMAGRGTDIVLGTDVSDLGGLYVLGSERHESRRIDNQLRGRSGRQGDPGDSQFYVSLEDDLMRLFGSDRISAIMTRLGLPDDMPIENAMISRSIEKAQTKVEKHHFSIRKQILEYDDVLNKQRMYIYTIRDKTLFSHCFNDIVKQYITDLISKYYKALPKEGKKDDLFKTHFIDPIVQVFPIQSLDEYILSIHNSAHWQTSLIDKLFGFYEFKKNQHPPQIFDEIVMKRLILSTLDRKWMDHLHNMDILREGIGLRAWGQRDPLIEYKREAFVMFQAFILSVYEEALGLMSRATLTLTEDQSAPQQKPALDLSSVQYMHESPKPSSSAPASPPPSSSPVQSKTIKTGRNELCPCGSGQKYKKCCLKK